MNNVGSVSIEVQLYDEPSDPSFDEDPESCLSSGNKLWEAIDLWHPFFDWVVWLSESPKVLEMKRTFAKDIAGYKAWLVSADCLTNERFSVITRSHRSKREKQLSFQKGHYLVLDSWDFSAVLIPLAPAVADNAAQPLAPAVADNAPQPLAPAVADNAAQPSEDKAAKPREGKAAKAREAKPTKPMTRQSAREAKPTKPMTRQSLK